MFGGLPQGQGLSRIELDHQNSVAMVKSIQAAGVGLSVRDGHGEVWMGDSLLIVFGGYEAVLKRRADPIVHILNTSKFRRIYCLGFLLRNDSKSNDLPRSKQL